jgi:hypothetical protein
MKIFIYHLYYRLHWWNSKIVKDGNLAPFSALLGTSMFKLLNLLSVLYIIFNHILNKNIYLPKWFQTVIMLSVLILDYFIYIYKSKYKLIKKETENLESKELRKRDIFIITYIFITFSLLIWMIIENFTWS